MPFELSTSNDVQGFLDSFLSTDQKPAPASTATVDSPVQTALDNLTNTPPAKEEIPPAEGVKPETKTKEEIEAALNKEDDAKKEEEAQVLIKDVTKLAENLKEKGLLIPYEDGSLPSTEEEIYNALEQSTQFTAKQVVDNAWREKVESLSPSLLRIHEFAAQGMTTAQQIAEFTNVIAQNEQVGGLDPKVADDQEQIVLLQLLNTGLDEKSAREEVADLKARNALAEKAARFFPPLKKAYEDNARKLEIEQQEKVAEQTRYVQTNAANVTYFLEKDTDYLPFKIDPRDRAYKAEIFNLAGQEVDRTEDGNPVFGWQRHLESLQYGTEQDYKRFMKFMAFLANDKKYEEGLGKKVASTTKQQEFKKIGTTQGTTVNTLSSEQTQVPTGIKKPNGRQPWSSV
jgi:hypothetical protein